MPSPGFLFVDLVDLVDLKAGGSGTVLFWLGSCASSACVQDAEDRVAAERNPPLSSGLFVLVCDFRRWILVFARPSGSIMRGSSL